MCLLSRRSENIRSDIRMAKSVRSEGRRRALTERCFKVESEGRLLECLMGLMPEKSRTEVKSYLSHRQISVNGRTVTAFDMPLHAGDEVRWQSVGARRESGKWRIRVVYEDRYLAVVEKRNGVLTMSTGKEGEQTAYTYMTEHVRAQEGRDARVFIVHRLDRETSGLLLFAKSEEVQARLQENWNENIIARRYVAVVEGVPEPREGQVVSWLTENPKSLKMSASPTDNGGKRAVTNYRVMRDNGRYALVEIELETGRKNQIRVQMASTGHPVAGDKKYGAQTSPIGRVCLHARSIAFMHPVTGERMEFDTGVPSAFK